MKTSLIVGGEHPLDTGGGDRDTYLHFDNVQYNVQYVLSVPHNIVIKCSNLGFNFPRPRPRLCPVHGMQQSDKIKYSQILITYLMLDSPDSG